MTTAEDILGWLNRAKKENATHMLVVCDTFDWDDYPVFVSDEENVRDVYEQYHGKDMQKVMEVYNLSLDIHRQLCEFRARNF